MVDKATRYCTKNGKHFLLKPPREFQIDTFGKLLVLRVISELLFTGVMFKQNRRCFWGGSIGVS